MVFIKYFNYELSFAPFTFLSTVQMSVAFSNGDLNSLVRQVLRMRMMVNTSLDSCKTRDSTEMECNAYNAAFYELGLRWHWDRHTFAELQSRSCERERLRVYLETHQAHLLRAYDADFLINAIEAKKADLFASATSHASPYFDWAESRAAELGV